MFELTQDKLKSIFFNAITGSDFKFKIYTLVFFITAIISILTIKAFRQESLVLTSIVIVVRAVGFYKLASLLHRKKFVIYWVSIPCVAFVIISSFIY